MDRSTGSRRSQRRGVAESDPGPDAPVIVQLLPHFLVAGELPALVVGEERELTPVVYAAVLRRGYDEADRWRVDEFGVVTARGAVVDVPVNVPSCTCRVDVLDAAGRLAPVNWAACPPRHGRVRVEGALYLDPEFAPGTDHGEAVALCRRPFRVEALRRYRRTAWRPVAPVPLAEVPSPSEASEADVYVAELRPLPTEGVESR